MSTINIAIVAESATGISILCIPTFTIKFKECQVINGADYYFTDREDEVASLVSQFIG